MTAQPPRTLVPEPAAELPVDDVPDESAGEGAGEGADEGADEIDALAVRAQRGDRASFEELVARLRPRLVRFLARRLGPADADDAAQETFLRAYRALDRYDASRRFSTWLFVIAKNVSLSHRDADRRRGERQAAAVPAATVVEHSYDDTAASEAAALWQRARRLLGDDAYHALYLRYARELTVREVARELGRSVVATKVMLFRARKKLLEEDIR